MSERVMPMSASSRSVSWESSRRTASRVASRPDKGWRAIHSQVIAIFIFAREEWTLLSP